MIEKLKYLMKRFNQVILVLPVWIVLGFSGLMRREDDVKGWQKMEKFDNYGKMY